MRPSDGKPRGLLVGRFQPFHRGHAAVVRALRARWPEEELILAIGSSQSAFTGENPFTAAERYEMIRRALDPDGIVGWIAVPLPDIGRHALWVAHAEETLPPFERVHTNNPLTRSLFERAGYPVESPELVDRGHLEGKRIRAAIAADEDWQRWLPDPVAEYLVALGAPARLRAIAGAQTPDRP